MKNTSFFIFISLTVFFLYLEACKKGDKEKNVSLFCLRDNDTVYLKITNNTDSNIYVPQMYTPNFTNNDDTLHFETIHKLKYSVTRYYRYKNILPFKFYTTREIKGIKADTIEEYKSQITFFNQFRVRPMQIVKPGLSSMEKLEFDVPKYVNVIQAVYYKKPFPYKNQNQYTYGDFLAFDSLYANHSSTAISNRYR